MNSPLNFEANMSFEPNNPAQPNPQQLACATAREKFGAYLDSAMSGVEMQAIAGHIESCIPCSREFSELRLLQQRLGELGAAPAPEFSVEVASKRPTEVIVQIKPGAGAMELKADSFAPPLLDSVALHRDQGRLQVRVTVSDAQAAGRYQGVIRAADGSIAGFEALVRAARVQFETVKLLKPQASRARSSELYLLAKALVMV